jgi:environmental stress-induced protein Ves
MVSVLDSTHFNLMDWKNKEGKTLQLAIYPPSATVSEMNFEWRLSSAFMQVHSPLPSPPVA